MTPINLINYSISRIPLASIVIGPTDSVSSASFAFSSSSSLRASFCICQRFFIFMFNDSVRSRIVSSLSRLYFLINLLMANILRPYLMQSRSKLRVCLKIMNCCYLAASSLCKQAAFSLISYSSCFKCLTTSIASAFDTSMSQVSSSFSAACNS